jgi:hypothetical protein
MLNMMEDVKKSEIQVGVTTMEPKEPKMEDFSPLSYAGKAVMEAVKSNNQEAFTKSLKAFVKMVYMECEQEDENDYTEPQKQF